MPDSVPTQAFIRKKPEHVHPRLVRALDANRFFPMTVTLQVRSNDRTPAGGFKSPAGWLDVDGLTDIPARMGPPQSSERQANERTLEWGRINIDTYVIVLNGYYPTARADMRVVTSTGLFVDIRGVFSDSDSRVTTLTGRIVDPGSEGFL